MSLNSLFLFIIIIISAVFHEYAHGWAAWRLGDNTAKDSGRLTLNPLVHIDPIGTILVPLLLLFSSGIFIGWAKPVPYNPYNLSDKKYGSLKVALAGPLTNILIALIFGLSLRLFSAPLVLSGLVPASFIQFIALIVYINIILAVFNLIPVPPLDGSKIAADLFPNYRRLFLFGDFLGIFLALFIGFMILGPISSFLFHLLTGLNF